MIKIFDGNNYFRRELEADPTGMVPRRVFRDMQAVRDPVIWVWDGANGNARRREVFPEYKMQRTRPAESVYDAFKFMQEVLQHTAVTQIIVPGYEGDDVVATLARQIAAARSQVEIYSVDFDFLQLSAEQPGRIFCGCAPKEGVPPRFVRLFKATVGDPSDNIPGIKGFGAGAWEANDPAALGAAVERWIKNSAYDDEHSLTLRPSVVTWLKGNIPLLQTMWDVVGFYTVPDDLIEQHTIIGRNNPAAAEALLRRFLL